MCLQPGMQGARGNSCGRLRHLPQRLEGVAQGDIGAYAEADQQHQAEHRDARAHQRQGHTVQQRHQPRARGHLEIPGVPLVHHGLGGTVHSKPPVLEVEAPMLQAGLALARWPEWCSGGRQQRSISGLVQQAVRGLALEAVEHPGQFVAVRIQPHGLATAIEPDFAHHVLRQARQVHPGQHGALQNHHGSHHQQCDAEYRTRHEGQQHLQAQAIQPGHLRGVHNQGL